MKTIVTHSGSFHADDVFAVATVLLSFPKNTKVEIIRTRDEDKIKSADYVVDVGRIYDPKQRRFDHHQREGAGKHENGILRASFGLVWEEYGKGISKSEEVFNIIKNKLVFYIDALDNGIEISKPLFNDLEPYTISDYFYSYWVDDNVSVEEIGRIFHRMVSMASNLLKREIRKAKNIIKDSKKVERFYKKAEDKRIIVLDKHYATKVLQDKPEPLIVVYPGMEAGRWYAKAVSSNEWSFESRILFPASWAGKTEQELAGVSGVRDAYFCHRNRFLAVAQSKEGAVALAKKALEA